MKLNGLHHVTCITGDAPRNLDFYTRVLGLRLVCKAVNQDDAFVYHLFYGDEHGSPGMDLTFFEYKGARPGRAGAGMVHRIVWRVATEAALDFWAARLAAEGVETTRAPGSLRFADGEGLEHELIVDASGDPPLVAEHPEIPRAMALQGMDGVRAYAASAARSRRVLEAVMGAHESSPGTWELRGESRRGWIAYDAPPAARGVPGAGTVHHVAWGAPAAEHAAWVGRLHEGRVPSTEVVDWHWFHSIYFREPNGVLFEIADDAPGFTVDTPLDQLGQRVELPPWFEPHRAEIEAKLTPLPDPRAGWAKR